MHLDEHQLGDAQQHRLSAGGPRLGLGQCIPEQRAKPVVAVSGAPGDAQQRRQRRQHRVERQRVAAQEAADHLDALRPVAALATTKGIRPAAISRNHCRVSARLNPVRNPARS